MSFVVTGMSASGGMEEIPVQTEVSRWGIHRSSEVQPTEGAR
jgi:hypothetical protein